MTEVKNPPLVTVAMVTYNSSRYVRMAIESVLASSYTNFELIISDDCSTDNTWEIINEYKDARIRAYRHEVNIGEYPNRNFCLSKSIGKYIIYIDGDDKIFNHGLKDFIGKIENYPECGMVISRPDINIETVYTPKEAFEKHYLEKTILNLALVRVLFNREKFIELGGFSTDYRSGDDFVRLLMASKYPILVINDGLVWWRKSINSASEKLFNSYSGIFEPYALNYYFLNTTDLLTEDEIKKAKKRLTMKLFKTSKSLMKRGKIVWLIRVLLDYKKIINSGR